MGMILVGCGAQSKREKAHYPFLGEPLAMSYLDFLALEEVDAERVEYLFADTQRVWFALPAHRWQGMDGALQGIYQPGGAFLADIRYVTTGMDFVDVLAKLQRIYQPISAHDYVMMDEAMYDGQWLALTIARFERRIADGQVALFVDDQYRMEVWNEAFFDPTASETPKTTILYRKKES